MGKYKTYLAVFFLVILTACTASCPKIIGGGTDRNQAFREGNIILDCHISCASQFGSNLREITILFHRGNWYALSSKVMDIGFANNLAYFYLARSAEGLGYFNAALIYYNNALHTSKCKGTIADVCQGFDFPSDISTRIAGIQKKIELNNLARAETKTATESETRNQSNTQNESISSAQSIQTNIPQQKKQESPKLENQQNSLPQLSKSQVKYYANILDGLVAKDSLGWLMNKYNKGSINSVTLTDISQNGSTKKILGYYIYNGSMTGWVEVEFSNEKFVCIRFHDYEDTCRTLRSPLPKQNQNSNQYAGNKDNSQCYQRCNDVESHCKSENNTTGFLVGMSGTTGGLFSYKDCSSEKRSCLSSCK